MNISEFAKPVTAKTLNESLAKRFGAKLNLDKFTIEQLQDARNKLRTQLFNVETMESFDSVQNDTYQKSKLMLDVLNAELSERGDIEDDMVEAKKPDADGDGVADDADPCPWDPEISEGARSTTVCGITSDPSLQASDEGSGSSFLSSGDNTLVWMGGAIMFMLALIIVAQVARAAGKRKAVAAKQQEQMVQASFAEEEERRQAWIQHYIAEGNYAEARALGWEGTEGLPEWKQYEMQQQAAQEAAIPTMMDLENL